MKKLGIDNEFNDIFEMFIEIWCAYKIIMVSRNIVDFIHLFIEYLK